MNSVFKNNIMLFTFKFMVVRYGFATHANGRTRKVVLEFLRKKWESSKLLSSWECICYPHVRGLIAGTLH